MYNPVSQLILYYRWNFTPRQNNFYKESGICAVKTAERNAEGAMNTVKKNAFLTLQQNKCHENVWLGGQILK